MKPTLLILAAGMGSRYGGLKQLDRLGPNGETIMDYSISYAIANNFGKIVFVIRKNMETDFREIIIEQYKNQIEIDYVFQELDSLPDGFSTPADRVKPYGTAHAILTAKSAINEPFVVINADDFYGKEAFTQLAISLIHNLKIVFQHLLWSVTNWEHVIRKRRRFSRRLLGRFRQLFAFNRRDNKN